MALTKLRQGCLQSGTCRQTSDNSVLQIRVFLELVSELKENKHRALVFSQFTLLPALVRQALDKAGIEYLYLDGPFQPLSARNLWKPSKTATYRCS